MRKHWCSRYAIAIIMAIAMGGANAGIPVFDASNFANLVKTIGLTTKQLAELQRIYQTSLELASQAQGIRSAVTGRWDPKDLFFSQEFSRWMAMNVPPEHHQLMRNAAEAGALYAYLKDRRKTFLPLTATQFDPWNKESHRANYMLERQRVNDQSIAAAKMAYEDAARNVQALIKLYENTRGPSDIAITAQRQYQVAIAQALMIERRAQLDALHQERAAQNADGDVQAARRWQEFVGPPIGKR